MAGGRGRWQGARKVWGRLEPWLEIDLSDGAEFRDDGAAALEALDDVAFLRHLLNQVEFVAVRAARGNGRSWAEIATKLGVTRQSAWERWHDLDEAINASASESRTPIERCEVRVWSASRPTRTYR